MTGGGGIGRGEGVVMDREGIGGDVIVINKGREVVGLGREIKGKEFAVLGEGLDTPEAMTSQDRGRLWSSIFRSVPGSKSCGKVSRCSKKLT